MSLRAGDLRGLVSNIFEIDRFSSKMGDDSDIVVLSFTVDSREAGDDLVDFIEKGFKFVLDADISPGELDNGKFKVFVEIERTRKIFKNIQDLMYGLSKLTSIKAFKFRYHKSFNSIEYSDKALHEHVPSTSSEYNLKRSKNLLENYDCFFYESNLDTVTVDENILLLGKNRMKPMTFIIENYGSEEVVEQMDFSDAYDYTSMAEIISLTRYIGDYGIVKCNDKYIFENSGQFLVLTKTDYEVINDS